jgi:transcriptional regulator with XRE-family HTH domain
LSKTPITSKRQNRYTGGRRKSRFGQLLDSYRQERGVSQTELSRLLSGFWSVSAINRYELGDRSVPPEFVYYTAKCLDLGEEQTFALVYACVADTVMEFLEKYVEVLKLERAKEEKMRND